MCDVAQALLLERVRDHALAAVAAGADVTPQKYLDDFEAMLDSEPEMVTSDQAELRQVLGV